VARVLKSSRITADIYSVAPHVGRGGRTWYTGSAGFRFEIVPARYEIAVETPTVLIVGSLFPACPWFVYGSSSNVQKNCAMGVGARSRRDM
jgi:hypothetical protein